MRVLPQGLGKAKPSFLLLLLLIIAIAAQVSAVPADDATTDTTQSISSIDVKFYYQHLHLLFFYEHNHGYNYRFLFLLHDVRRQYNNIIRLHDNELINILLNHNRQRYSNAPYMQESNAPEGTVFIAVGAALGLIGLTLLAWRAMVAWSVNRSVRRAAVIHASESKRLLRGSRKKRSAPYPAAPAVDVSLDKLGAATRASYKPKRAPSASSGLFFSPTAGGPTASHHNPNATGSTGNRGSTYLPAGYYAAAGGSNPAPGGEPPYSPTAGLSSPSLPPAGVYHDSHNQRHSYVGASTSSLNLNQAPQGRAPSAYLEDLFESHAPHGSDSGHR
nr:hypothetical protein FAC10E3_45 [Penicillium camemberti]